MSVSILPSLKINSQFLTNGESSTLSSRERWFPLPELFEFSTKGDRRLTWCGLSINVITGGLLPVCVLFSGKFLDAAKDRDKSTVDFWCGLQLLSGICCFIAGWVGTWCLERSAANQYARLKANFFHSTLDQDQDYLMTFDSGELADMLSTYGELWKDSVGIKLGQIVVCLSQFVTGFIVGLTQHWKLTFILLGMLPVLVFGGGLTLWSLSVRAKRTSYQEAANVLEETITNIKTIISYNLENVFLQKFATLLGTSATSTDQQRISRRRLWLNWVKNNFALALVGLGMGISMGSLFAFYALGFWAQGKMLASDYRNGCLPDQAGCLSVGKGITVFFCVAFGSFSLGQAAAPLGAVIKGKHAVRVLKQIIERPSAIPVLTKERQTAVVLSKASGSISGSFTGIGARTLPVISRNLHGSIEFRNVGYAYVKNEDNEKLEGDKVNASRDVAVEQTKRLERMLSNSKDTRLTFRNNGVMWVFRNLNILIKSGSVVAFIGPSGCGKSTIAKLILRFSDVVEGSIALDGVDLRAHDITHMRDQMGYVGQEPQLFDDTVYNNILHGNRFATEAEVVNAARAANAHDFIVKLPESYSTMIGESGSRLSGGQRQRVAIARAILRKPKIMVLDEATSALDNKSEAIVLENIHRLVANTQMTVIMIAHRLTTIRKCDSIFVFNTFANVGLLHSPCKSFLQEQGCHNHLVRQNGLYCQMLRSQNIDPVVNVQDKDVEATEEKPPPVNMKSSSISFSRLDDVSGEDRPKVPSLNFKKLGLNDSPRLRAFQAPIPSPLGKGPKRVSGVPRPMITVRDSSPPPPFSLRDESGGNNPGEYQTSSEGESEECIQLNSIVEMQDEPQHSYPLPSESSDGSFGDQDYTSNKSVHNVKKNSPTTNLIEGLDENDVENAQLIQRRIHQAVFRASFNSSESLLDFDEGQNDKLLNLFPDFVGGAKHVSMKFFWPFFGVGGFPWIILGMVGAIGNGAIFPLFALSFAHFIKVLSYPSANQIENELWDPTRVLLLVSLGCFCCNVLQHTCVEVSGNRMVRRLRFVLFDHVIHLPASFFAQERLAPGYLMTLISNDPLIVKSWASDFVFIIVQNVASLILATVIASKAHFRLAMISLAGFAASLPATILQQMMLGGGHKSKRSSASAPRRNSQAFVVECLRNPKTIDAFNLHLGLALDFDRVLIYEREQSRRQAILSGFFFGLGQLCQFGAQSLNLWCGGRAFCNGEIDDVGQMMQATFTMIIAAMGIGQAASAALDAAKGKTSGRRIKSMLDVPIPVDKRDEQLLVHHHTAQDALIRSKSIVKGPIKQCHIRIRDLQFSYPPQYTLEKKTTHQHGRCCHRRGVTCYDDDYEDIPKGQPVYYSVDLEIPSGKSVALVGESGCGKTTLVQLLERFYEHPGSNHIMLNGVCIKRWPLTQLQELMALVPQEPILFNDTVAQNIAYGNLQGDMDAVVEAAKQASAHEFIMQLPQQYNTSVGLRGEKLSGGQRQKIAIARALMKNAPILLLDEATSALDPASEVSVQETLDQIKAKNDRTIITIAHRLSSIRNYNIIAVFDKITEDQIKAGGDPEEFVGSTIREIGNHETLMAHKNGIYKRLVLAASAGNN